MRRYDHSATVRQIAAALDIDPDQLVYFRECHPDPTVDIVLNLADKPPVDGETRARIDEWLTEDQGQDQNQDSDDAPGGDPSGLLFDRGGDER